MLKPSDILSLFRHKMASYCPVYLSVLYLISPVLIYDLTDKVGLFSLSASVTALFLLHCLFTSFFRLHIFLFPLYLIVSIDLFMIVFFDSRLTSSYIAILIGEGVHSGEFIKIWWREISFSAVLFSLFYSFILYNIRDLIWASSRKITFLAGGSILAVYLLVCLVQLERHEKPFAEIFHIFWGDVVAHDKSIPLGYFSQTRTAFHIQSLGKQAQRLRQNFHFLASSYRDPQLSELYILVIGESSRPQNWGLSGYHRNTTPRLQQLDNLIFYPNTIAEAALTKISVPLILTRKSIRDYIREDFRFSEKSIVSAFQEAGFSTTWLSNVQTDVFSGEINQFAQEADRIRFMERRYDSVLLNAYDDVMKSSASKKKLFFVFHTQGSHFDYEARYPEEFARYRSPNAASKKELITDAYDNSIYYTDYFLDQIINRANQFSGLSSVLYVSDHGENLLDDERNLLGHFQNNEFDLPTSMLVWVNDLFKKSEGSLFGSLARNRDLRISTESVFSTLLDLGGVEVPGTDMIKSLSNDNFIESDRWVIRNFKLSNYDDTEPSKSTTTWSKTPSDQPSSARRTRCSSAPKARVKPAPLSSR